MSEQLKRIEKLKKEKDAVILAHYYVPDEVQKVADYVGDSYYLSKLATEIEEKVVIFCGVSFMGESAKILNPSKKVLLPEVNADCPMAHMVDVDVIRKMREEIDDLAVVCYVNSTAYIKSFADVCVTSSNAVKIVKNLPNKHIFFIPDENLGRYVATKVPEKIFHFNDGFCHVHKSISRENVLKAKEARPNAKFLVHPECTGDVLELADYIGSTAGIIDYATNSSDNEFIIGTEMGVFFELAQKNPEKKFFSVGHRQFCPNMKSITLQKVEDCLINLSGEVTIEESTRVKALVPLTNMLKLAK